MSDVQRIGASQRSLNDLRENFSLGQLLTLFLSGDLEKWLSRHYYEKEEIQIKHLEHRDCLSTRLKLCTILGLDPTDEKMFSPEQAADILRRREHLAKHTQDPNILIHAAETALDQADLSALLDNKLTSIWLCGGPFSIPIRKGGICYTGIGNPCVEGPFTEAQYRKAGITFQGVLLPETSDAEMVAEANQAAEANGYDFFADSHTPLAVILHRSLICTPLTQSVRLKNIPYEKASRIYKSRHQAEQIAAEVVDQVYDEANDHFIPGTDRCLAKRLAATYANLVRARTAVFEEKLASICGPDSGRQHNFQRLHTLLQHCEEEFQKIFEKELEINSSYYQMYQRQYFHNIVQIVEQESFVISDGSLLDELLCTLQGNYEYTLDGYTEITSELEKDMLDHAGTFWVEAHRLYQNWCAKPEVVAELLGKEISLEELEHCGLV